MRFIDNHFRSVRKWVRAIDLRLSVDIALLVFEANQLTGREEENQLQGQQFQQNLNRNTLAGH